MNIAHGAALILANAIGSFVDSRLAGVRFLAVGFALTTAFFYFLQRGTNYYLFPVYPTMFVVGAVLCERLNVWIARGWIAAALAISASPVRWSHFPSSVSATLVELMDAPSASGRRRSRAAGAPRTLTQSLSDEFLAGASWSRRVAAVYHGLSPEEQKCVAIPVRELRTGGGDRRLWCATASRRRSAATTSIGCGARAAGEGSLIIHVGGDPEPLAAAAAARSRSSTRPTAPSVCPMRTACRSSSAATRGR